MKALIKIMKSFFAQYQIYNYLKIIRFISLVNTPKIYLRKKSRCHSNYEIIQREEHVNNSWIYEIK